MPFDNEKLKLLREKTGYSLREIVVELGEKTGFVTDHVCFSNWETNTEPRGEALMAISEFFKKDIKFFYK